VRLGYCSAAVSVGTEGVLQVLQLCTPGDLAPRFWPAELEPGAGICGAPARNRVCATPRRLIPPCVTTDRLAAALVTNEPDVG